jgi:Bacterial Ig-like domain (group 3)/FG-GAP-like repeat/FG-GAP repeat
VFVERSAKILAFLCQRTLIPAFRVLVFCLFAILSILSLSAETFRNPRHIPTGADPASLAVGDLNGDGWLDIVYGTTPYNTQPTVQTGTLHFLLAQPNGTYASSTDINLPSGISPACNLADFNGDGKLDLLCASFDYPGNIVAFSPGNGDGTFGSFVLSSLTTDVYATPYLAAVGDVNNDGHLDAILTDAQDNRIYELLGDGSGHFSANLLASNAPGSIPSVGALGAILRDLNGDGNLDLLVQEALANDVAVFLGNGDGSFQSAVRYAGMASLVLGDADGDGQPDIAVLIPWERDWSDTVDNPRELFTFYGNGHGSFSAAVPGPIFVRPYSYLIATDVDNDGRADLILDNVGDLYSLSIGPAIGIVHGQTDRTLGPETNYVAGSGLSSLFLTDLNGDHFPDILAANGDFNETANSFTVLLNQGNKPSVTGTLTAQPESSELGQTFQVTASLSPPSGTPAQLAGNINLSMDGVALGSEALSNNSATITVSSKPAVGTHLLSATWPGDATYDPVTLTGSHVVIGLPSTTSLSVSPNPVYALQSVTLTATVTAANLVPTGTVTFLDGGTSLGTAPLNANGVATFIAHFPAARNHVLTAVYGGDATFNTSTSSSLTENVLINPSDTTLNVPFSPVSAFQPASLVAIVLSPNAVKFALGGPPSGTVTFYDGTTNVGSSAVSDTLATLNTASFAEGTHSLTAVYSGDSAFAGSTSPVFTLQVLPDKSTTTLSASPNTAPVGTSVTLNALVTVPMIVPAGTVVFYDGATALGSSSLDNKGSATFSTSSLSVGQHSISSTYTGTANFLPSSSPAVDVTITPFTGDFGLGVTPASATISVGESHIFTVLESARGGFNQNLALSCSGLPAATSCTFAPASIPGGRANSTLTIQTSFPHQVNATGVSWLISGSGALTSLALLVLPRRLRRRAILLSLLTLAIVTGAISGCGTTGPITGGTPPGTYNVTIAATASQSGQTLSHSATVKLAVKSLF